MFRSLDSGVTGLANNQLILDTTANNLANISTNGFKASRVSFSTALLQTQSSGASPTASSGGVNPRQIGLGSATSSVDVDMRQGALVSTGRTLDLAIQGEGFFRVAGADGSSAYTRVGNFNTDSQDNLVDLGSGMFVQGRKVDSTGATTGDRMNINLANNQSINAKATSNIVFQGNLSSTTPALQGNSVSSILPMTVASTGLPATDTSLLSSLTSFTGPAIEPPLNLAATPPTNPNKTISIFGTKPDGTPYAGTFTINPWQNTVQDLVTNINAALVQGQQTIGTASIADGKLTIAGSGSQSGFSVFLGEQDPLGPGSLTSGTDTRLDAGASPAYTAGGAVPIMAASSATPPTNDYTIPTSEAGLLNPTFTVVNSPASNVTLNIKVTSGTTVTSVGAITIPAGTAGGTTFSLPSLPHVNSGDVVSYEMSSASNMAAGDITYATTTVRDSSPNNLLRDTYDSSTGTNTPNGSPDLFEPGSTADVNAYVYAQSTNATMDWYKMRLSPATVTQSIQVYDSVGGSHTVQAAFIRTGTTNVVTGGKQAVYNSWDMVLDAPPSEGKFTDPVVVGIQFDDQGRYVGNGGLGTTAHGTTLSDPSAYKGTPSDNTVQVKWASTGDATMSLNFGDAGSSNGLTGGGGTSTAAAVDQDGYASGSLSSLSVTNSGNVVGLYSNGKSLSLYQIEVDTFRNPGGLSSVGQNLWQVSANSGDPLARTAGEGGAGTITAGALEGSNVDIASEFTKLITAQRGFQVASKVIQTTDSMLQDLTGLIR
jgi:flagellar hook protein FlgE